MEIAICHFELQQVEGNWIQHIKELIISYGFKQTVLENNLYVLKYDEEVFLLSLYVDGIIIAGSNLDNIHNLKKQFTESFDIKNLGELNHYLDLKIIRSHKSIKIDNSTYARKVVKKFKEH